MVMVQVKSSVFQSVCQRDMTFIDFRIFRSQIIGSELGFPPHGSAVPSHDQNRFRISELNWGCTQKTRQSAASNSQSTGCGTTQAKKLKFRSPTMRSKRQAP